MQVQWNHCLMPISFGLKNNNNMKKKLALVISILSLVLLVKNSLASQQMDDFLYQFEKYHQAYGEFKTARDKYLTYKTLTAKDEAVEATSLFINQRYQTLRTHFLTLIWKLRSTSGVVGKDYRDQLVAKLDKEVTWMDGEMDNVTSLNKPDLEDLFILSDRVEARGNDYKSLGYQSLSAILLGKVRSLQADSVVITNLLKDRASGIEATSASQLNDWLREVENQNYLSQKKIEEAEANLVELVEKTRENQMIPVYQEIKKNLQDARQYLMEAVRYQQEILKVINSFSENE